MGRPAANSPRGAVVVLLLAALLAGCGSDDGIEPRLACPDVVIVRDASELHRFRAGAPKTPENLALRGRLAIGGGGGCEYDDAGVTVTFPLQVIADRGPAFVGDEVALGYFVAIVRPDGSPWARQAFSTTLEFENLARRVGSEEMLEQTLPVGEGVNAGGYQIVLGFQLTPEELDWNRRPRQAPVPRLAP